jgi:putative ABC transport system permease protein
MFSSYLAAAWRSFVRDRLYALINVIGLAIGLSAAVLSGMYIHNELTFEQFLPGYEQIYRISAGFAGANAPMSPVDTAPSGLAPWLKGRMPWLQPVARLSGGTDVAIRVGQIDSLEHIRWADPEFFDIFRFPVQQGDLVTALQRPDAVVLTRSAARRLFGRDRVVGETFLIDHEHTMRVAAVMQDLPSNTHFNFSVVGSSKAEFSSVAIADRAPAGTPGVWDANTYFRLGPGVSLQGVRTVLDAYIHEIFESPGKQNQIRDFLPVMPIAAIHLAPEGAASMRAHVSTEMLYAIGGVGLLILAISIINFVNLSTARAARRKIEVAVRKAVGATQGQLIVQFIGEAGLLFGPDSRGDGVWHLQRCCVVARMHGPVRPGLVCGGAPDQGDRYPQGNGGRAGRHPAPVVGSIDPAGTGSQRDCLAGLFLSSAPLAGRVCLSRRPGCGSVSRRGCGRRAGGVGDDLCPGAATRRPSPGYVPAL